MTADKLKNPKRDPYIEKIKAELKELEAREKELKHKKRVMEFNALPQKEQRILKALGLDPYRGEQIETAERKYYNL